MWERSGFLHKGFFGHWIRLPATEMPEAHVFRALRTPSIKNDICSLREVVEFSEAHVQAQNIPVGRSVVEHRSPSHVGVGTLRGDLQEGYGDWLTSIPSGDHGGLA